jgi:hypothetical protein
MLRRQEFVDILRGKAAHHIPPRYSSAGTNKHLPACEAAARAALQVGLLHQALILV